MTAASAAEGPCHAIVRQMSRPSNSAAVAAFTLSLLAALGLDPARAAAPAAAPLAAPASAVPAPAVPAPVAGTSGAATTASGLHVTATVHPESLVGFPVVVAFTVKNDTAANQTFPDLAARPHLVRFTVDGPRGKSERYNTPPAFDVATAWALAPHSQRDVLLEIPSSAAFPAGDYTVTVSIQDPGGPINFAPVAMSLAVPRPLAGTPIWEPTIAQNLGTIFPWVQDRGSSAALYLMQFDARAQTRAIAQYWIADLEAPVDPVLSRSRPGDSFARYLYWLVPRSTTATLGYGRLEGTALRTGVKTAALPYPTAELFDRGITDSKGQLVVPMWIPAPSGKGGSLKAWTLTERGAQSVRNIVDLPVKPTLHATAIDAASNLLVSVVVSGGVDVYKVDPAMPAEIPARGTRHWAAQAGWAPVGVTFDTLPDAGARPGGLSLYVLTRSTTPGPQSWKSQWSDLAGNAFSPAQGTWNLPGILEALLTNGYGPFYALSRDSQGAWWYEVQGGAPVAVPFPAPLGPPSLFISGGIVRARALGGPSVVTDLTLGPKAE